MANQPPPTDGAAATNRVGSPRQGTPKPTFSQFGHWAWLNKALSDAGWRYYSAVRSYIFDADEEFEVDITDEVIGELLGKSAKSIGRARRDCYTAGVIEELAFWKESVRIEGKSKPEVRTFRRLIVHHEVPDGYEGPVNAYREKRRIEKRRSQEQGEARAARASQHQGPQPDCEGTGLSGHSDQGKREKGTGVPAQCEGTDLSKTGTDLSHTGGPKQGKQAAYLPYHLPSHQPTSERADDDVPAAPVDLSTDDGWLDRSAAEDDEEQPARAGTIEKLGTPSSSIGRENTPSAQGNGELGDKEPAGGGNTDTQAADQHLCSQDTSDASAEHGGGRSAGYELLTDLGVKGTPRTQWAETVTTALEVLGTQTVGTQLAGGKTTPGPGAIVQTRLPGLKEQLSQARQSKRQEWASTRPRGNPRWCGDCEPVKHDGRPTCRPGCDHTVRTDTEDVAAAESSITADEATSFMNQLMSVN